MSVIAVVAIVARAVALGALAVWLMRPGRRGRAPRARGGGGGHLPPVDRRRPRPPRFQAPAVRGPRAGRARFPALAGAPGPGGVKGGAFPRGRGRPAPLRGRPRPAAPGR